MGVAIGPQRSGLAALLVIGAIPACSCIDVTRRYEPVTGAVGALTTG